MLDCDVLLVVGLIDVDVTCLIFSIFGAFFPCNCCCGIEQCDIRVVLLFVIRMCF